VNLFPYIVQVLRMVMYFNPLRVLMPVALTLLAATFIKAGTDLVVRRTATDERKAPRPRPTTVARG
jgi:hypothetical protein